MSKVSFHFQLEMEVRDYELDAQSIVNNSVYLNYLEHGRHEFIRSLGLNFIRLHEQGFDAVVIRTEIDYKRPLMPNDRFLVRLRVSPYGKVRYVFDQEIVRLPDEKLMIQARIFTAFLRRGRPTYPEEVATAMEALWKSDGTLSTRDQEQE